MSSASAGDEPPPLYGMVQRAIREATTALDIELHRADDIFAPGVIMDQIRAHIEGADYVIAVCTGRNANVFYELGLADAYGHQPVLLASSTSDLPFDVSHRRSILYGDVEDIQTIVRDLRTALEATTAHVPRARAEVEPGPHIAEQSVTISAVPTAPASDPTSDSTGTSVLDLLAAGNVVVWDQEAKRRIGLAGSQFDVIYGERSSETPTDALLDDLEPERHGQARAVASWLCPAAEYRSDWLAKRLPDLARWFNHRPNDSGYTFWISIQQSWTSLVLRSLVATALEAGSEGALVDLVTMSSPGSTTARGDGYPFLLQPDFTWPEGYGGNSEVAHQDFLKFASLLGPDAGLTREPLDLACGTSFLLAMAAAAWGDVRQLTPVRLYAGFATAYCARIGWVARLLEESQAVAVALGFKDLEEARAAYRELYPSVVKRIDTFNRSCDSWEQALKM
jgi:hypothetical protein